MENPNNRVFLNKIAQRIKDGDFDRYLNLPFMTKELLYVRIKDRIERKIKTGGTPILTDSEIKDCLEETKQTAVSTFAIFVKQGLIERTEEGYKLTPKGEIAVRATYRMIK